MELKKIDGTMGYFFGRLDFPDELTIAFLGDNDDLVFGMASILEDIGEENLKVVFQMNSNGWVNIVVQDKRDPSNFMDTRLRAASEVTRFLAEFIETGKFVITVGDFNLNMAYDVLRLEMDEVEWKTEYIN